MAFTSEKSSMALMSSTNRIEVPFIKVTIGNYTFGAYTERGRKLASGQYDQVKVDYPKYVKSLRITKINGQVNQYELVISYPIQPGDDPNFFEKVLASVSKTRKIIFTYGDVSAPEYIYKNEQAIITNVATNFSQKSAEIGYTISAVSSGMLGYAGGHYFEKRPHTKPSTVIYELLERKDLGLKDIFYGMQNVALVKTLQLIDGGDAEVDLDAKENVTVLDYIKYLVSCMVPVGVDKNSLKTNTFFIFTIHDEAENQQLTANSEDKKYSISTSGRNLGGPYFTVKRLSKNVEHSDAYEVDIGYPSANTIINFQLENNQNYSIFFDYNGQLSTADYVYRINADSGKLEKEFSNRLVSLNHTFSTGAEDRTWWTKVTEYPIGATITLRGLLRPALLMEYLRVNIYFFGRKHIGSGLYVITKQIDEINESGYKTTLTLMKVSGSEYEEENL